MSSSSLYISDGRNAHAPSAAAMVSPDRHNRHGKWFLYRWQLTDDASSLRPRRLHPTRRATGDTPCGPLSSSTRESVSPVAPSVPASAVERDRRARAPVYFIVHVDRLTRRAICPRVSWRGGVRVFSFFRIFLARARAYGRLYASVRNVRITTVFVLPSCRVSERKMFEMCSVRQFIIINDRAFSDF